MATLFSKLNSYKEHFGDAAWTGIDQLLSSLSNLIISLAIARSGGANALGLYAIAFAIYLMVFGFQRALISDPLLTLPTESSRTPDDRSRFALGATVLYLIVTSVAVLGFGLVTRSGPVIVLALFLPLVCLQDQYRHLFFRQRRPHLAALLDGIWVAFSLVGWIVIAHSDAAVAAEIGIAVWGCGGTLGALIGGLSSRAWPSAPRRGIAWWMDEAKSLGGFLGVERALSIIFTQVVTLGMAAILGTADLGRLRGAQIVLGPVGLILTAFQLFVLPRLAESTSQLSGRTALVLSSASAGLTLVGTTVLWVLAPWLIPLLYGESLELPAILVLATGAAMTIRAFSIGPVLQLKALQRGGPIAGARLVTGIVSIPVVLGTAAAFGLIPAVWAQTLPALSFVVVLYVALPRRGPEATDVGPASSR